VHWLSLALYGEVPYVLNMPNTGTRSERVEARTSPDVLAMVKRAADIQGRSLSDFIMSAAEDAAKRAIAETHIINLTIEDQRRFAQSLLAPPEPSPAIKRALERRSSLVEER
jgi:uncharacterized protein (DUF1778 family)